MESHISICNKFLMAAFLFLLLVCPNHSTRTPSDPLQIAADGSISTHGHRKLGRAGLLLPPTPAANSFVPDHPSPGTP